MIGENDTLKITDFGISRKVNESEKSKMTARAGTSLFIAPEVIQGSDYNEKADVYSFGILTFEVLFETVEPYGPNPPSNIDMLVSSDPQHRPKIAGDYKISFCHSNEYEEETFKKLIELMSKCWNHEPSERPDFKQIVSTLTEIEDLLE